MGASETDTLKQSETPHYSGHRGRLRERFITSLNISGESTLPDYELLEMILFASKPRGDVKPLAKELIKEFGSISEVLNAQPQELARVNGMGDAAISAIKAIRASYLKGLAEEVKKMPLLNNWEAVINYCQTTMGRVKTEQFRIFFLDKKNRLIADELQQQGTVDHTPVYPREVCKRALELNATALILSHNHPSGDVAPSKADIEMTRSIIQATAALGIMVHDHIIIGAKDYHSMAANGQM